MKNKLHFFIETFIFYPLCIAYLWFSGIRKGSKLIYYQSGYDNSAKQGGQVTILRVTGFYSVCPKWWVFRFGLLYEVYGYDLKEEYYIREIYNTGEMSIPKIIALKNAQKWLKNQFRHVSADKEPSDFYQSARDIIFLTSF